MYVMCVGIRHTRSMYVSEQVLMWRSLGSFTSQSSPPYFPLITYCAKYLSGDHSSSSVSTATLKTGRPSRPTHSFSGHYIELPPNSSQGHRVSDLSLLCMGAVWWADFKWGRDAFHTARKQPGLVLISSFIIHGPFQQSSQMRSAPVHSHSTSETQHSWAALCVAG